MSTLYTVEEISRILCVDKQTVYKYIRDKRIDYLVLGTHPRIQYRIPEKSLNAFIRKNLIKAVPESKVPKKRTRGSNKDKPKDAVTQKKGVHKKHTETTGVDSGTEV